MRYIILLAASFTLCAAGYVYADEGEISKAELLAEIRGLKAKLAELESRLKGLEGAGTERAYREAEGEPAQPFDGLKIGAGATFIVQGTVDANNNDAEGEDVIDASYSVDIGIEKEFGEYGLAFLHLETGDGAGVEDELEVFSNVNRDADDSDNAVSVTEAWYEHYLLENQLTITAGKLDPTAYVDQNEIANCECTQFLGRIFRNASTIDFTDNNAGARALIAPAEIEWIEIEAQALDGDGDWEDVADTIFTTCQINLKPQVLEGLSGNYRVYGWYKDIAYTKWDDAANTLDEDKAGFGVSVDQQITDIFTVFGRYGWADPDYYDPNITSSSGVNYSLEHTWSAGLQLNGRPWSREQDHIGLAVGMDIPSDEYKDAGVGLEAEDETHIECYYAWLVNEHLTLSPDIQVIFNPFGKDHIVNNKLRDDTITVLGCRGQVDF